MQREKKLFIVSCIPASIWAKKIKTILASMRHVSSTVPLHRSYLVSDVTRLMDVEILMRLFPDAYITSTWRTRHYKYQWKMFAVSMISIISYVCARDYDDDGNRNRNGMQFMKTLIEFSSEWHYFAFNENLSSVLHETCTSTGTRHTFADTRCTTTSQNADARAFKAG